MDWLKQIDWGEFTRNTPTASNFFFRPTFNLDSEIDCLAHSQQEDESSDSEDDIDWDAERVLGSVRQDQN